MQRFDPALLPRSRLSPGLHDTSSTRSASFGQAAASGHVTEDRTCAQVLQQRTLAVNGIDLLPEGTRLPLEQA